MKTYTLVLDEQDIRDLECAALREWRALRPFPDHPRRQRIQDLRWHLQHLQPDEAAA